MRWHFNRATWELVPDPRGRIRPWMVILLAPILGACFVVYLPIIGVLLTGRALGERAAATVLDSWATGVRRWRA